VLHDSEDLRELAHHSYRVDAQHTDDERTAETGSSDAEATEGLEPDVEHDAWLDLGEMGHLHETEGTRLKEADSAAEVETRAATVASAELRELEEAEADLSEAVGSPDEATEHHPLHGMRVGHVLMHVHGPPPEEDESPHHAHTHARPPGHHVQHHEKPEERDEREEHEFIHYHEPHVHYHHEHHVHDEEDHPEHEPEHEEHEDQSHRENQRRETPDEPSAVQTDEFYLFDDGRICPSGAVVRTDTRPPAKPMLPLTIISTLTMPSNAIQIVALLSLQEAIRGTPQV
jgi:hypothetical protein